MTRGQSPVTRSCSTIPAIRCPRSTRRRHCPQGEVEATRRLETFLERVDAYDTDHDRLDVGRHVVAVGRSEVRHALTPNRGRCRRRGQAGRTAFVRQIAWRDWYAHLLAEIPTLTTNAMRERYDDIEWRNDPTEIAAWKGGITGYPVIDAGMRQLRQTGWMHNRARLLCGSFLVKNLLVDWRIGERHFRHLLVDGDVPQNVGNWQWVAGTGPDAAATTASSTRSSKVGSSIRTVPTSDVGYPSWRDLDADTIHAPWEAAPTGCSRLQHRRLPAADRRSR